jgi:DNA polymerase
MPWTERQAALLQGLGLRLWSPPPAPAAADAVPVALPSAVASPAAPAAAAPPPAPAAAVAIPAGAGPLDWPALRQAVAGCRACGLCEGRTQTVFGTGHPQAHWLLVGEAPGEQEDLQGLPFVGAAGQLLDRMLAALGLTRAEDGPQPPAQRVYIANALKCRPPRNRNPTAQEMASCAPYLQRQIELLQPRLILALGRFAVQALLHSDEPIGKLRGRVHHHAGVPLIVSYHPAYLLRSPLEKAKAWEDLCLAAGVAEAGAAS